MNQELARKRPAQVVRRQPVPQPTTRRVRLLAEPTKARLLQALEWRTRSGQIERTSGDIELLTHGQYAGYYAIRVVLVPPRKVREPWPRWAKVCIGAGSVLAGLALLVGALAWLLQSLAAIPLGLVLGVVLVGFVIWVLSQRGSTGGGGGSARGVEVDVSVSVRVR